MSNSAYHQLDKFIDEYEEDSRIIKTDKLIMQNYPKVYVMSIASTFERDIKERCQNFIDFPLSPLTSFPQINSLMQICARKNKPITDGMFAKFHTKDPATGMVNLDATGFYDLFGGAVFKCGLETLFNNEQASRLESYQSIVDGLTPLLSSGEQYEREYAKNVDIRDRLLSETFNSGETAFLNLKLRRNKIAHDYINGLSDTFENIRDFYLDAVVYVIALEKAIDNLTDIAVIHPQ
ncbi:hypothetical protein [Ruminococcus gauvreauii]|uniref:RiboL-PSP-HEPN domain-containing protein n=1 Tax=Ruminococcus gauvreauii TaxID=438033 RepID=A0ABY5VN80_9FIRM|nr:hypothetical protein [Ruminococcus gauvreauii]UWP60858.1 hypothetical protein NQ502_07455 [Ruminococcus gauvreauii]